MLKLEQGVRIQYDFLLKERKADFTMNREEKNFESIESLDLLNPKNPSYVLLPLKIHFSFSQALEM